MGQLEASTQLYTVGSLTSSGLGGVQYDGGTGVITIKYSGTANFVHETTHAGQFETGDIAFAVDGFSVFAQDLGDEVAAYKAQCAYDQSSVIALESSSIIGKSDDITAGWVQNIVYNGVKIYNPRSNMNNVL